MANADKTGFPHLSDAELFKTLRNDYGYDCGPVVASTRSVYEQKLAQLIKEKDNRSSTSSDGDSSVSKSTRSSSSSLPESFCSKAKQPRTTYTLRLRDPKKSVSPNVSSSVHQVSDQNLQRCDHDTDHGHVDKKAKLACSTSARPLKERNAWCEENKNNQSTATIMNALQLSENDPSLIGDFTRPHALPIICGKHSDLKTITPETLAQLIRGNFKDCIDTHTIIDGRFPYEYEGGHIIGAINIYTEPHLLQELLDNQENLIDPNKDHKMHRHVLVFHCEFSSKRAPTLFRFLRNKDRECNISRYPKLFYPEIYLLEGGYKAFYEKFKDLCRPEQYVPMMSKDHKEMMKLYFGKPKKSSKAKGSSRNRHIQLYEKQLF